MGIFKASSLEASYKYKASASQINELNGRGSKTDLTKFTNGNIAKLLEIKNGDTVVDVGCGDCSFFESLIKINGDLAKCKMIGVLPNMEEIDRISQHIKKSQFYKINPIKLHLGKLKDIGLPKNTADTLILNSVLHGVVSNLEDVRDVMQNVRSILKPDGVFFLGEVPIIDELSNRGYSSDSIIGWLYWILKNRGLIVFWKNLVYLIKCITTKEPFIIEPKNRFFITPEILIRFMSDQGFKCVKQYRHQQIDDNGKTFGSPSRWNYIFTVN